MSAKGRRTSRMGTVSRSEPGSLAAYENFALDTSSSSVLTVRLHTDGVNGTTEHDFVRGPERRHAA